jgi:arginine-tRNA-protein transferase
MEQNPDYFQSEVLKDSSFLYSEPCPYLPGKNSLLEVKPFDFSRFAEYEELLADGWRRSGVVLYRYRCELCARCIPIRISTFDFAPHPSQRRCIRANADIEIRIEDSKFLQRHFALYKKYLAVRHDIDAESITEQSYRDFLISPGSLIIEYDLPEEEALVGISYLDILPNGLSSIYFVFDPEYFRRSLGTFSILRESAIASKMGMNYYYLGFWVPFSRKMDYKSNFAPFELATQGLKREPGFPVDNSPVWRQFQSKAEAIGWLHISV